MLVLSSLTLRDRAQRAPSLAVTLAALASSLVLVACTAPPERAGEGKRDGKATQTKSEAADAPAQKRKATIPADGWNDAIAWRGLDEGLREAKSTDRPIMLVVHTSWCSKCRALKGLFNRDEQLAELSEQFIMVHADQDNVPQATLYAPDGTYIPRVMFLDSDGKLDKELQNPNRSSKFRYFYTPQEDLVGTMREALDRHGNKS